MSAQRTLVIVFARTPIAGHVKTRLANQVGEQQALRLYQRMLAHTAQCIARLQCDKHIVYTPAIPCFDDMNPFASIEGCSFDFQKGCQLGARIAYAFETAFKKGYKRVLVIGSDCVELQTKHLETALQMLTNNPAPFCVIGPAKDGGYYLIGLNHKPHHALFAHTKWGTDAVLMETIGLLKTHQTPYGLLEPLNDIDHVKDIPTSWR